MAKLHEKRLAKELEPGHIRTTVCFESAHVLCSLPREHIEGDLDLRLRLHSAKYMPGSFILGIPMEDYAERYGSHLVKLVDRRYTQKEFEFDQILLMPTAKGYRDLVEQARIEINPRIMNYLSKMWSKGTIENLSFFAMAVAVYARSISEPPLWIDVGRVLLRTAAFCNLRCTSRMDAGGGCQLARDREQHHLPKCIKLPRAIEIYWQYLKRYIATGGAVCARNAIGVQDAMRVEIHTASDFAPAASC